MWFFAIALIAISVVVVVDMYTTSATTGHVYGTVVGIRDSFDGTTVEVDVGGGRAHWYCDLDDEFRAELESVARTGERIRIDYEDRLRDTCNHPRILAVTPAPGGAAS